MADCISDGAPGVPISAVVPRPPKNGRHGADSTWGRGVREAAKSTRPDAGGAGQALKALAIGSLVLPILLFAGFSWLSYESHWRDAHQYLDRTADLIHEHAIKVVETQELLATQVEEMLRGLPDDEIRTREREFHDRLRVSTRTLPQIQNVWVLDADGYPLLTANNYPVPRTIDASDREYFQVHRSGSGPRTFVSEILRGRAQSATFFQFSRRRERDGRFAGVIAVSVQPDYFEQFYARLGEDDRYMAALIRADGSVLARHPKSRQPPESVSPLQPFVRAIQGAPESGSFRLVSPFDDIDRITIYRKLPDYPVYIFVGLALADIRNTWLWSLAGHLVFGLPATLGLFALSLIALVRTRREATAMAAFRAEVARREATEAQLRQSQKLQAVGQLTGGIAHDFNNLLTVVSGNLDLVMRRLGETVDERIRRGIMGAMDGAARAAALTHRLLAFSRQQPLDPKPTDVNRLIGGMSDLLRRTLGETIEMEVVLSGGLWPVNVDPPQLESALLNLGVNARDAMPGGGRLTIETSNTHLDDRYARAHDEVVAGQYVMIAVSDTGTGMSPEVIAQAFEPFFTTKPKSGGTGLGLSQVYGFVKQSGGHVKIYSEVGRGSSVKVYLPRSSANLSPADRDNADTAAADGQGVTILVVEDDPSVRRFSVEALRELGYRVVEANDAAAGLRMVDQHPGIALIFTDVVLPGGASGRDMAEEAKRRRPDLKIVFTTGYTQNAIVHNGVLDADVLFLGKPFTVAALGRKIEQALADRLSAG